MKKRPNKAPEPASVVAYLTFGKSAMTKRLITVGIVFAVLLGGCREDVITAKEFVKHRSPCLMAGISGF